jgi:tetratricopeptide (TPR) repeat protein
MINRIISVFLLFLALACGNSSKHNNNSSNQSDTTSVKSELLEINNLLKENPDNAELYFKRAEIYAKQKLIDEALQDVERALKLDSLNEAYYIYKGDLYIQKGDGTTAEKTYLKATKIKEDSPDGFIKLSELMYYGGYYDDMLKYANEALKRDMYNDRAYFNKGYAYLKMGDTTNAISSFQTAVEQNNELYDAYIILGYLMQAENNPLAEDYFKNALRIKPGDYQAKYNLAYYYQETGNYNKAIELYNELHDKFPKQVNPLFNLGFIHLMYLHVYDIALDYFNKVLEIEPNNYKALFNRGYCKELTGDIEGAENDYKKVLEINPVYTPAALALERFDRKEYHIEPKH